MGITLRTLAAIKLGQFVEYNPCITANPKGIVLLVMVFKKISGPRKSFHDHIKVKIPSAAKAGLDRGRKIRR